jgi:hypothetical protein
VPAADDLKIEFNDRGLASIAHHGVELLAANQPGFRLRDLNFVDSQAKDGNRQVYEPKLIPRLPRSSGQQIDDVVSMLDDVGFWDGDACSGSASQSLESTVGTTVNPRAVAGL